MTVGELEFHPFDSAEITRDEWDVMLLLIRDCSGHGGLATSIDAPESAAFVGFIAGRVGTRGIGVSSHNQMDLFPLPAKEHATERRADVSRIAGGLIGLFERICRQGLEPEVIILLEGGFGFSGNLAWMSRHVFSG